ncbi:MAG: hypothetical protein ACK5KL_09500 [Dysgonomonas sp.]
MGIEDIEKAEWGYLLDNPNVIFRIEQVNEQNETIEYHLLNDERRHPARFSEVGLLDKTEVPDEIRYENTNEISISQ